MTTINFVSLAAVYVSCQTLLTSTLPMEKRVCPRDEIIFTCTVRGSLTLKTLILAWNSTKYVGEDLYLQFTSSSKEGSTRSSMINTNVIATLTNNTVVNGVPMLESQLRVIVSKDTPTSIVTCHSLTSGNSASIEFHTPG